MIFNQSECIIYNRAVTLLWIFLSDSLMHFQKIVKPGIPDDPWSGWFAKNLRAHWGPEACSRLWRNPEDSIGREREKRAENGLVLKQSGTRKGLSHIVGYPNAYTSIAYYEETPFSFTLWILVRHFEAQMQDQKSSTHHIKNNPKSTLKILVTKDSSFT